MTNTRVAVGFVLALLMLASPAGSAPQKPAETPKITTTTDLVLVPVIVRKSGTHLGGLKKESFTLLEDSNPQEIAVFEEVHAADAGSQAAIAGEFTNQDLSGPAQRLTVIAIDLVNTAPLDQAYLKQEVTKFLDGAQQSGEPYALVAITTNGIHVLQDFTANTRAVAMALAKTQTQPNGRERPGSTGTPFLDQTPCLLSNTGCGNQDPEILREAERELRAWQDLYRNQEPYEIFRDRSARLDTLSSLIQIAQWLKGVPGRKTLVWAGSGILWFGGVTRVMTGFGRTNDYSTFNIDAGANQAMDENAYTFRLLSAANVAVYPLDARHGANTSFALYDVTRSDAPIGDRGFAGQKGQVQNDDQERITMFQQIAATTGGRPCFNRTDLANCMKEFAADSHDYYMLGFYADKKTKPGWHTLTVKLDQRADLRHRSGFVFQNFNPEAARMTDLQLAILSPLPYTSVEIRGRFTGMEEKGSKRLARFELNLPPEALTLAEPDNALNFDVVAVVRGTDGKEAARLAQRISRKLQPEQAALIRGEGIHYSNQLELAPGSYGVWFVVRDNATGRTGSVATLLAVQ